MGCDIVTSIHTAEVHNTRMDLSNGFSSGFFLKVLPILVMCFSLSLPNVVYPGDEYTRHPSSARFNDNGHAHTRRRNLSPPAVRCSDNDTFCEDVTNYPEEQVKILVGSNSSALRFLQKNAQPDVSDSILHRKRPTEVDEKEKRVCDVITKTVFPKAAKTSNNVWKYVVNADTTYKQGIEIEQCSKENSPCNLCTAEKSRCVQKFIGRKMLVFDENELDSYIDLFNFPAACICYVSDIF